MCGVVVRRQLVCVASLSVSCFVVVVLDPNTKRFKRTLIYYDTDTQYANFRGNLLSRSYKTTLRQQIDG